MLRTERVNGKPIENAGASGLLKRSISLLLTLPVSMCPYARASESMPAGAYDVTTEIGMPHLQENLRYATVRERRCVTNQALASAFPILEHESLNGCRLGGERRHEDRVFYVLTCEGGHGTTGTAHWRLGSDQIRGTLDVKLGGKNMTFYQTVTAQRLGECASDAK